MNVFILNGCCLTAIKKRPDGAVCMYQLSQDSTAKMTCSTG